MWVMEGLLCIWGFHRFMFACDGITQSIVRCGTPSIDLVRDTEQSSQSFVIVSGPRLAMTSASSMQRKLHMLRDIFNFSCISCF